MDAIISRLVQNSSLLDLGLMVAIVFLWRAFCKERDDRIKDLKDRDTAIHEAIEAFRDMANRLPGNRR